MFISGFSEEMCKPQNLIYIRAMWKVRAPKRKKYFVANVLLLCNSKGHFVDCTQPSRILCSFRSLVVER